MKIKSQISDAIKKKLFNTFIINEEGVIERIISPKEVKTKDHAAQILK